MKNWGFFLKNKLKFFWYQLKNKKAHIPDFNRLSNILRVLVISYLIFFLFNISISDNLETLLKHISQNVLIFTPYLLMEMVALIISSPLLKRVSSAFGLVYMFFSIFISNFVVYSIVNNLRPLDQTNIEPFCFIFLQSVSILFFFIIYFDWKIRAMSPLEDLAKINFLQSKMDPHFLFNALNTVMYLIRQEPKTAQKMITNLSDLIRATLVQNDLIPVVTVENELNLIDKYLQIEQIRLEERLVIEKNIEEKTLSWKIPRFLIQPLVENAVNHGVQSTQNPDPIRIKIYSDLVDNLIIEIKNSYMPHESTTRQKTGHGISIKNIKGRIDLYYQGTGEMEIHQTTDEFYVYIKIPKEPLFFALKEK